MKIRYKQSDKDSRFLTPMEGVGNIDVVSDMSWTLSPKSARKDVPYVRLTEYQQTTGQLIAAIIYYGRVASRIINQGIGTVAQADRDPFDVYKYKYFAEPTGFSYKFPYFNVKKTSLINQFGETGDTPFSETILLGKEMLRFPGAKGLTEKAIELPAKMSSLFKQGLSVMNTIVPGKVGFETPKSWSETEKESYTISFDLFNSGTVEDIENNRNLCHLLHHQNAPSRRNFAIIDPPVIYSLSIPDVVHMPACWMSNLEITNLGNTRLMYMLSMDGSTSVPRTIPEAYRISMTFTSILLPSRNILSALDKGSNIEAISDITPFRENAETLISGLSPSATDNDRLRAFEVMDDISGVERFSPGSFSREYAER